MTKTALYGLPEHMLGVLTDTAELPAGFCVWLSAPAKYADTDIFKGRLATIALLYERMPSCTHRRNRYLSCLWDVDDMVKKGKEIASTEAGKDWLLMQLVI